MTRRERRRCRRPGLAPLEFVLWLPILLFVAALMLNYGTAVVWRIRGETVSRDAAWRVRWPHNGTNEGAPRRTMWPIPQHIWPREGEMRTETTSQIARLDDPGLNLRQPVVRGPLPNGFRVNQHLDPDRTGAYRGVSEIVRDYPLLPRMGDYESGDVRHAMLRGTWQYMLMGMPANRFRRTTVLYELPKAPEALSNAYINALEAILDMPNREDLDVLDRDEDFIRYRGRAPDFHPQVNFCELDPETVYRSQVQRIIDSRDARGRVQLGAISRLPRTMTSAFLGLYRQQEQRLQNELNATPPPSPSRRAEIQRELSELRVKISQLEAYQGRLPGLENDLRRQADMVLPP